ncbi:MAG TPA: hypothetical protein PK854_11425 [Oscillospiraceae bacterium]|mgnify:CR=1 FL=1|nr:hypothetical protein [Oscillospiraceae bacterium]HPS35862.1 hypothetical protein [Oscillospiraceae bacterium]
MKRTHYETLYRKNETNGRVIIDISLENYLEFFHEWDNAVFKKRDLNTGLTEFLNLCSEDIPLRKKLEIVFCVNTAEKQSEKEDQIRTSYRNYYISMNRLEQRKTKRLVRFSGVLLFTSIVLLTAYTILNNYTITKTVYKVLLESLLIGGWVFTWEAVHLFFLDIFIPFRRRREIMRLLDAEISFKYICAPTPSSPPPADRY